MDFSLNDAAILYYTGMEAEPFRDESQSGRFSPAEKDFEDVLWEQLLAEPEMKTGSILWTRTASDALLLKKIHEIHGHRAYIVSDGEAEVPDDIFAVLTSWDIRAELPTLPDSLVLVEIYMEGGEQVWEEDWITTTIQKYSTQLEGEIMETIYEPLDDHFHLKLVVQGFGSRIPEWAHSLLQELGGESYSYHLLSEVS